MISINICSRLNFVYEWYPKEGDHYNILLKDNFRRKLFKRLKEFLSVEDKILENDLDNSVISKLTNEGIKVNIDKNLDISSGNFFFDKNKNTKNDYGSVSTKGKFVKKENKKMGRKESGFSFLDISFQKNIKNNEFDSNINIINDYDINNKSYINNKEYSNILDNGDILGLKRESNNEKNNINNEKMKLFNKIEDIKYNNVENYSYRNENKGKLINDSFGYIEPEENLINEDSLSFGK